MFLSGCNNNPVDIALAVQRNLPDMPAFCRELTRDEINAALQGLVGQPPRAQAAALGTRWLQANGEKAACRAWYGRQQRRYAGGRP